MTSLAKPAKRAVVHILFLMTFAAMSWHFYIVARHFPMTGKTIGIPVRPAQLETGLFIVVEIPGLPVQDKMAKLALRAKTSFMPVILAVACLALNFGLFEIATGMTGFTA